MGLLNFLTGNDEAESPTTRLVGNNVEIYNGTVERAGTVTSADPDLVKLVYRGWTYRESKNAVEEQLKNINEQILNSVGVGASITVVGICKATLTERTTVEVKDPDRLAGILGTQRFNDLVNETVKITASDKLIELANDADHPLSEGVRSCLAFNRSQSVTYRLVK